MILRSRPYESEQDWDAMMALLVEAWRHGGLNTVEGVGSYCWWRRHPDWAETLRLWEDERGRLVAFSSLETSHLEMHIHPDHPGQDIEERLLVWAEAECRQGAAARGEAPELRVGASDQDAARIDLLERHGYQRGPADWYGLFRSLAAPIEEAALPEGFRIRPLSGEAEIPARVEIVQAVWPGNKVPVEKYREIMGLPQYRPELDLVAVAPDGTLAAFCSCWLDEKNWLGEFEPVGTHPVYRQRGLGRAIVLEGLRRLKAVGAETAFVFCHRGSEPALRLYQQCGMSIRRRDMSYSKSL
jgi:mycothiol synthase